MDDDGPGWEIQQDNEERRRSEEEALARGRQTLADFRRDNAQFENDMAALNQRIRNQICKA
jgi:hypothetical protein